MDPVERMVDSVLRHHYLEENYDMGPEEFQDLVRAVRLDMEQVLAGFGLEPPRKTNWTSLYIETKEILMKDGVYSEEDAAAAAKIIVTAQLSA